MVNSPLSHKSKKMVFAVFSLLSLLGYGYFVFAAPPGVGGYNAGETLDPECTPGQLVPEPCIVQLSSGGSGWSLTGDTGTTAGTNFIGTTDAEDFMIKTNGNQVALFGQNGNVAMGGYDQDSNTQYVGAAQATGLGSIALGGAADYSSGGSALIASGLFSVALGNQNHASGIMSFAAGNSTVASGNVSTSFGADTIASGDHSTVFGGNTFARSYIEFALGTGNVDYTPNSTSSFDIKDRLFNIGNSEAPQGHNAYTLWKDGSFAYNDDNFQNDNLGTEQNMFYFNYGNHDGLGSVQTKQVVRLGSALNSEWDINSANIGDRSIAIGFGDSGLSTEAPVASGSHSTALGSGTVASGNYSTAFGSGSTASGTTSTAFGSGSIASGNQSTVFGISNEAFSKAETALGMHGTDYTPLLVNGWASTDRLVNIGNGDGAPILGPQDFSDAFTILKSGLTGIGYDNFETTTLTALLQVNGEVQQLGATSCALSADSDGMIICTPSDENLKTNINNLTYGLDTLTTLRPVSYTFKDAKYGTGSQIGFIAQELGQVIPEVVTNGPNYKSVNYGLLSSVIVSAIQEMNLNVTDLNNTERPNTWRDSLIAWLGNVGNGITKLFAGEIHTDTLCVGQTCLNETQVQQILQTIGSQGSTPPQSNPPAPNLGDEPDSGDPGTGDNGDTGNGDGGSQSTGDTGASTGDPDTGSGSGDSTEPTPSE